MFRIVVLALLAVSLTRAASAQQPPAQEALAGTVDVAGTLELPESFAGAPPPQLPASVSRDAEGRTTVRAVRLTTPLRLDGSLDEALYRTITPISGFVQNEPANGEPATEKTEIWLSFDADNVYVSMRASESAPERMIVNEMRRDSFNVLQNENFQFAFDTFHDGRNAVSFQFNPIGGRMDGQVTNESQYNGDWNPIWNLHVQRTAGGWTAEAAVPFKSLRFRPGTAQIWGFQSRRINRWKNEVSYLTPLPAGTGVNGHSRVSNFSTMVGLEVPSGSRPLDLKPYVTSNVTTDLAGAAPVRNKVGKDFGFDAKYAVTQNLTADFTYNTDFAQVEADEQQINLSRFSLFFPEKREFFLENQGIFQFGGANSNAGSETPVLFYSRRIGLDAGQQIPLEAGGRLSGRVGRYTVGVMNIQTEDVDAINLASTNFTAARVKRDILRRSSIGAIVTRRSVATSGAGDAGTLGVDGTFAFFSNLSVNTYWAQTKTPGTGDDDTSYRAQMEYAGDRYGVQLERTAVGRDFDPQVGFMRREDFHKMRGQLRFSPRPVNHFTAVRKFTYQTSVEHFTDPDNNFESRERHLEFSGDFNSSDSFGFDLSEFRENIVRPFTLVPGVEVPAGEYKYTALEASFTVGQQRRMSGTWTASAGQFYGGTRTTIGFSGARVKVTPQFSFEPGISINRVDLPYAEFTAKLASTRATYTITPLMFVSGLVQYNSTANAMSTNVRLRWEYQPGSELFVVYNDGRDTFGSRFATLQNRALIFKINKLFRF
jgi:hypothetical protein